MAARLSAGDVDFRWHPSLARLAEELADAAVIAVDIPIGLPSDGYRRADEEARLFLENRRSSVYLIPPEVVLRARTYGEARLIWREKGWKGVSCQAFALRDKVLEAASVARTDPRLREVHPELSFRLMNGGPLRFSKHSWDGLVERLDLLRDQGLAVPLSHLGLPQPKSDDVLDAVAAAWSAQRIAAREARSFPPDSLPGEPIIWG